MAKYLSNKFKSLKIGLGGFSENLTSLTVVGKVGIGSTLSLNSVTGIVSAVSFKRHGGTSSEFLMADGSVNDTSFLSSYTETDTLDTVLGRGNISGIGLSVGVVTSTSFRGDLIGNVTGNADTATTAGIVTTAAQPNITSLGTLASLTVQGNVSVGGTLTYEDVTNVDALGIVTARSGIHVGPISAGVATVTTDGNAIFSGIVTATKFIGDGSDLTGAGVGSDGSINTTGIITATTLSGDSLMVGAASTPTGNGTFNPAIQQIGTDSASSSLNIFRFSNDTSAASIRITKSRSTNPSSLGIVQQGDQIGNIYFLGDDGDNLNSGAARILAKVTGTPESGSGMHMPLSLSFWTAPDGGGSAQERLTVYHDGNVGINRTVPTEKLDVDGTVKATTFVGNLTGNPTGSGANLTNLPAANLTGSLPAISGANLTDVLTTDIGGKTGNLTVSGISTLGIGTAGDPLVGKVDLFHEGEIRLKTTPAGIQVVGVLSATSLDFTGANGAFNDDLLLKGASANVKWDKSESYLQFNDGAKAVFGTDVSSGDLEIYHSGSQSYINEDGTGELLITTGIGTTAAKVSDGSITLYHQGTERLRTTASGVTISGNISGTISGTINGNASTATDLAITGATEQLVIQTGNNATDVITSGTAGYVLQSNGSGNAPTWAAGAPANAIEGITLREDGVLVGSANSISTINFVGAAVTFTNPTSGIATVTISSGGASASPVMMSMIFG